MRASARLRSSPVTHRSDRLVSIAAQSFFALHAQTILRSRISLDEGFQAGAQSALAFFPADALIQKAAARRA
jgi:hypothetical protein